MEHSLLLAMPHPQWHAPVDPVCGRLVGPIPIPYHACHGDQDYYFCSLRCMERFGNDPARYHWAINLT